MHTLTLECTPLLPKRVRITLVRTHTHYEDESALNCTWTIVHPKALVVYSNGTITMVLNYDHHQKMTGN